jgi:hypothetical protein
MRIAIVDTYYPAFLNEHYAARPGLERGSYERQHASLLERCFGTGDAYSRGLRAHGHEAVELVANCAPLQLRWAADHGAAGRVRRQVAGGRGPLAERARRRVLRRLVHEQAEAFSADVVYLQDTGFLTAGDLAALRRAGLLVVGQLASPAPPMELLRGFDLIVSSFPHFVERFRREGIDSEYLPLAFDAAVLDRLRSEGAEPDPAAPRPHAASFVGGVHPTIHARGTTIVERACAEAGVEVWGYGADALPADSPIRRHYHGEAWGLDMYAVLARSKIVLNRHIDVAEGYANNMRMFEATGTGALLLTESAGNLADLFAAGDEVVTYRDGDELVARLRDLADDDDRRRAIAAAGQARTLREHTYERRMGELADILGARVGR